MSTSVRRGPCGPCCSVAPVGMMTVWCVFRNASTSGFVISPRKTVAAFTDGILARQAENGPASPAGHAVFERERAAVSFRDLPAQGEADAGAGWLRREERDEEVGCVGQPRAFVLDPQVDLPVAACPRDGHGAAPRQRRVHAVT